jgi:DNA-binding NarL/FixJ family response regulator
MVRVILADDHTLVRSGIRSLLEGAGIDVIGEAADGQQLVTMAAMLDPDLVFVDVSMPIVNGIEAARQLRQQSPDLKIVMLSMHTEPQYVNEATAAGANGYVLKDSAFRDVLDAIEVVMDGRAYLSPGAAQATLQDGRRQKSGAPMNDVDKLSQRERQVLKLIADGQSSTQIGKELVISARTADTHRKNIMDKLGIRSIAGLTRFAIRHGLCPMENNAQH